MFKQVGLRFYSTLEGLDQHQLSVGSEVRLLRHPAFPLVHQLFSVRPLDIFYYDLLFISAYADLMMRRSAMKYKSSTTSLFIDAGLGATLGGN